MEKRNLELSFDEIESLCMSLDIVISKHEADLRKYELVRMKRFKENEENKGKEYIQDSHESGLQQLIDYKKELKSKINDVYQNF